MAIVLKDCLSWKVLHPIYMVEYIQAILYKFYQLKSGRFYGLLELITL